MILVHVGLVLQHFSQVLVFVDQHLQLALDLLIVLVVVAGVVELLDGLGQLGIDSDQFLQGLLENAVLLLKFLVPLLQLFVLTLTCEVVLEPVVLAHQLDYKSIKLLPPCNPTQASPPSPAHTGSTSKRSFSSSIEKKASSTSSNSTSKTASKPRRRAPKRSPPSRRKSQRQPVTSPTKFWLRQSRHSAYTK
jgi:hypothetical protein